ncbi:hypothetical protein AB1Y20_022349 [Prymnesium parvum]|uniref:Glycerophosphocholine acyltransferase 1 n=1 Tax=Prymnesium parvum TaxID=97485 RepID=A0AB34JFM7_PRYPA
MAAGRKKWLLLDNDGSYNGFFNFVPRRLRVGPWSPVAWLFLVAWPAALYRFMPPLLFAPPDGQREQLVWSDVVVVAWCCIVIVRGSMSASPVIFFITYTGWSWLLLTAHAGSITLASICTPLLESHLLWFREAIRFPLAVSATITAVLWNFLLLPFLTFYAKRKGAERRQFLRWNFNFTMSSIHVCNVPLAWLSLYGGSDAVRTLGPADLWVAMLLLYSYAVLYLFVLDRFGLHFYCMFSPRSHLCGFCYAVLLACYVGCFRLWGGVI